MRKYLILLGLIPAIVLAEPMLDEIEKSSCKHKGGDKSHEYHIFREKGEQFFGDLDLSETQKSQIAELMKQSHSMKREQFHAEKDLMKALNKLAFSADYDDSAASKLIQQISEIHASRTTEKVKMKHEIFQLLTDEQKLKLSEKLDKK